MKKMIVFVLALLVGINVASATNFGQDPLAQEAFINSASSSTKAGSAVVENGYMVNNATKEIVEVTHTPGKYTTSSGEQLHLTSKGQEINRFFKTEKGAMNYADKLGNTGTSAGSNLPVKYEPSSVPATTSGSNLPVKYEPSSVPATTSGSNLPVKRAVDVEIIDNRVPGNKLPVQKGGEIIDAEWWKPVDEPIKDPSRMLEYKPTPDPVKPTPDPVKPTPDPVKPTPDPVKPVEPVSKVGKITAGQAIQAGTGLMLEYQGLSMARDAFMEEGEVSAAGVFKGAVGGATAAGGIAMALNAIPVVGQVGYASAIATGAALGAGLMLTRVASQGDCVRSAVYPQWTHCCNITDGNAALMGAYTENLAIGRAIHSDKFGYINYCMQCDHKTDQGWKGKFMDDHWSEPEVRFCPGYSWPEKSEPDYKYVPVAFWDKENGHTVPCWKWECADQGMKREGNKCVPGGNSETGVVPGKQEPDKTPTYTCDDWNTAEQKYCCKNAKTGKHRNNNLGVCVCNDSNKKWEWDAKSGTGKCVDRASQPDDNKSDEECWYTFEADVKCANGATIHKNERKKLDNSMLGGASCDAVKANLQQGGIALQGLINLYCGNGGNGGNDGGNGNQNADADKVNKIKTARENLSAFFKKVDSDRSVWKNADGSFNAARLASDLTAGVVLGTVGGVVSGVLIKKSQVEKGFDALNCTVNGQKVADWGDEFSVGLRR